MTETRNFIIDHTDGEVSIMPKAVGKAALDPDAARALAHIIAEHAGAADRRRRPEAIRELRSQIAERNDIARQLTDALDAVARLRDDLAGAREAFSAKAVEFDALAAKCAARTAELARIREWEGHRSGSSAPEEIA